MTQGHIEKSDPLLACLRPLRRGVPVKLVVEVRTAYMNVPKLKQIGLLIAPGTTYGLSKRAVVVSLLGSGSCVVFPTARKSKGELVKAGLPAKLAQALLDRLNSLYGDRTNGRHQTHPKSYTRRQYRSR